MAGYRVYYNIFAVEDMSQWAHIDIGPYTVTDITDLDVKLMYAVKVQARSVDGRYGELSETKLTTSNIPKGRFSSAVVA